MTEKKNTTEPVQSAAPRTESITSIANSVLGAVAIGEGARAESHIYVTNINSTPAADSSKPRPEALYADEASNRVVEQIRDAKARKAATLADGADTVEIDDEIQQLRNALRESPPQLCEGFCLSNRYTLIGEYGRGGYGTVWKARDKKSNQYVAVKILLSTVARDPFKVKRFFDGAKVMARTKHDAIVRVLEPRGEDSGHFFIAMEFLGGGDLKRAVQKKEIALEDAVENVLAIADALSLLHKDGLTHRDVKPANIVLTNEKAPRLTDFDILHDPENTIPTAQEGQGPGTFLYSAPEVFSDPRGTKPSADVYSLGRTLMFCICGRDPPVQMHDAESLLATLAIGTELKAVIKRATDTRPAARYQNATEFAAAVRLAIKRDAGAPRRRLFALSVSITISVSGIGYIIKYPPAISPSMPRLEQTIAPLSPSPSAVSESTTSNAMMSAMPTSPALSSDAGPKPPPTTSAKSPPPITEKPADCPDDMIRIPAGEFLMGTAPGGGGVNKQTVVMGQDYCIDKTEVTVEAYEECTSAKGCSAPASDPEVMYCSGAKTNMLLEGEAQGRHPITCVTWTQANTFCKWAEKRLPTEEEWEYAARGPKSLRFPWGDQWPKPDLLNACDTRCSNYHGTHDPTLAGKTLFDADDKSKMTAKVGSYPKGASPFGVVDMAGNVAEWADGFFCSYKDATCNRGDKRRVMRGSSWRDTQVYQVEAAHRTAILDKPFNYVGFRCAKSLKVTPSP